MPAPKGEPSRRAARALRKVTSPLSLLAQNKKDQLSLLGSWSFPFLCYTWRSGTFLRQASISWVVGSAGMAPVLVAQVEPAALAKSKKSPSSSGESCSGRLPDWIILASSAPKKLSPEPVVS